jgi:hypothetical protein
MEYSIRILDDKQKLVGEMMTASYSDIAKFINKGFTVIDTTTGSEITMEQLDPSVGCSDGAMILNG